MSRIGRKPITIPAGVEVKVNGNTVTAKGPKGSLEKTLNPAMTIEVQGTEIIVSRPNDEKENKALHGLTRTLVANMVEGVSKGFSKELEVNGVGYRVNKQGNAINLVLGFSHPVIVEEIPGITLDVPNPNKIVVSGPDKQIVGQVAAEIRGIRPPEPYKGKGIKYADEVIVRKEGKAGKAKK
ncbi:MAG: 50S ribosomal protein L6 [Ruminococcaceae bacterium]|nr:50S ribosomal protein L6 [Oscillospiraceae bacterium]